MEKPEELKREISEPSNWKKNWRKNALKKDCLISKLRFSRLTVPQCQRNDMQEHFLKKRRTREQRAASLRPNGTSAYGDKLTPEQYAKTHFSEAIAKMSAISKAKREAKEKARAEPGYMSPPRKLRKPMKHHTGEHGRKLCKSLKGKKRGPHSAETKAATARKKP